jgi:hypothetical protein
VKNQHDALFLLYFVTAPFKATVGGPSGPPTVALEVRKVPLPHYTFGLLMMG